MSVYCQTDCIAVTRTFFYQETMMNNAVIMQVSLEMEMKTFSSWSIWRQTKICRQKYFYQ